ncbi:MAG: hypothetical protein FWH53_03495 [Leptospirales bacterium]|nr:hypothetical protein [Leptospirales bacterium]
MKKHSLFKFFIVSCIFIIIPCKGYGLDITLGGTAWYSWWDFDRSMRTIDIDPAFLYGPVLSVKLNENFNFTFAYLYGKFDYRNKESGNGKISRSDSDLALNYRLNDYLKIFAGIKYMAFAEPGFDHGCYGPGLGLSSTVPLPIVENLFFVGNLSGFYLWGDEEKFQGTVKSDCREYGVNSTLSLAYYIATASTVITFGGRLQYFKTDYGDSVDESGNPTSNIKHMFYGITLTATYTFSF